MHQLGGDSGVDTTADGTDNLTLLTADLPNPSNLLGDKALHTPAVSDTTDILHKRSNDLLTPGGVRNLGVELDTINRLGFVGDGGERGSRGGRDGDKVRGKGGKLVTVRHPDLTIYCQHTRSLAVLQTKTRLQATVRLHLNTLEQCILILLASLDNLDLGVTVLPVGVSIDGAAVDTGDLLETIADTEDGNAEGEDVGVDVRSVRSVNRVRGAGKDDT